MKRICSVLGCLIGLGGALVLGQAGATGQDAKKGTVVELGSMKSKTPATWLEEAPSNTMRYAQFKLPKAEKDARDAEVVIFKGITGSAKANIDRWKLQFRPPEGKTIDDVAKVTDLKVGDAELKYLDVQGTYLFKAAPFDPNAKTTPLANYRMVAVVFDTKETPYHIRMVGPEKTVTGYKQGFDDWLKAFK